MKTPSFLLRASAAWVRLSDREQRLVLLLGAVFCGLVVAGGMFLMKSAIDGREKRVALRREEIAGLEQLRGRYEEAVAAEKRSTSRIQTNSASLFSVLQNAASEVGLPLTDLNERRTPVKDSQVQEVTVDVVLRDVSIDKLHTLLEKIEGARGDGVVKVTKMKVKTRFDAPDMLEVSMTVSTWKSAAATLTGAAPPATGPAEGGP